jgi:hypothetical protein
LARSTHNAASFYTVTHRRPNTPHHLTKHGHPLYMTTLHFTLHPFAHPPTLCMAPSRPTPHSHPPPLRTNIAPPHSTRPFPTASFHISPPRHAIAIVNAVRHSPLPLYAALHFPSFPFPLIFTLFFFLHFPLPFPFFLSLSFWGRKGLCVVETDSVEVWRVVRSCIRLFGGVAG